LWSHEAELGREEGSKDRPCAIVLATREEKEGTRVWVLPITHRPPSNDDDSIAIPSSTKRRLGLDDDSSWIVLSETNDFIWPGPDLRRAPGADRITYGLLPPRFFDLVRSRFAHRVKALKMKRVKRGE
jgi:hypothetical protein